MKKLKMILPMFAFILAIGMSFAFVETSAEKDYYATKFIQVSGGWATINVECGNQQDEDCLVRFSDDPSEAEYNVYNSKNTNDLAKGDGRITLINGSVPNAD